MYYEHKSAWLNWKQKNQLCPEHDETLPRELSLCHFNFMLPYLFSSMHAFLLRAYCCPHTVTILNQTAVPQCHSAEDTNDKEGCGVEWREIPSEIESTNT